MSVRAKFVVQSIKHLQGGSGEIVLTAVYAPNDPHSENGKFWKATPSGNLTMQCVNPEALAQFSPGEEFYLTFDKANA